MPKISTALSRRLKKKRQKGFVFKIIHSLILLGRPLNGNNLVEKKGSDVGDASHLENIEFEYVPAPLSLGDNENLNSEFANVIQRFTAIQNHSEDDEGYAGEKTDEAVQVGSDSQSDEHPTESAPISKKKMKKMSRMSLAELKHYAKHPEIVEWEDVTSPDPKLLVQLKATRHSVPVPRHWCQKRKYLSGKRGFVKPAFELPSFIRDTGITELRDTMRAQDATKRIKVKAREKMHPKLGRITVDYEKLYDAFFKYQTKPPLTGHGELYYEGREFDGKVDKKPGFLSEELRSALGMTNHLIPPPWLLNMQKYGPPPSYPHIKLPGLNAPIPDGAQWGYHPGGWGKPPNDSFLRDIPIHPEDPNQLMLLKPIERNLWGELEPEEEYVAEEIITIDKSLHETALDEETEQQQQNQSTSMPALHKKVTMRDEDNIPIVIPDVTEPIEIRKESRRPK